MYPQQPPNVFHQGGYSQQPAPYGVPSFYGPGMSVPGPVRMPAPAVTVRVLMFIGGGLGLLLTGLLGSLAVTVAGEGPGAEGVLAGMRDSGLAADEAVLGLTVMAAVPFLYGAVSILLASLLGRRSRGVLWSVVVFQGLAAVSLVFYVLTGVVGSVIPLAFAVLMLLASTRAYYSPPSADLRI